MRRLSLGALLGLVSVALVTGVVIAVGAGALRQLRRVADEEARARVALAAATAARVTRAAAEDVDQSAALLAERPTLRRLFETGETAGLHDFLDRFAATGRLAGCAVRVDGALRSTGGEPLPWQTLGAESAPGAHLARSPDGSLFLVSTAAMPGLAGLPGPPGRDVLAARRLDAAFEQHVAQQVGLPVAFFIAPRAGDAFDGAHAVLRERALESRVLPVADRIARASRFVGAVRLALPPDDLAVGVEAHLDFAAAEAPVWRARRDLMGVAVVVAGLAALTALLLARDTARPLARLTAASARIGRGDLTSPVPREGVAEIGQLASSMEEMRSRLLRLTSELRRRQSEAEAVLGGIVEGVVAVDAERRIRYLNAQAAALLGVQEQAAIGRFCGDVLDPQDPRGRPCEDRCPIVHARFRGGARAVEHLLRPDGGRRTVVITSAAPSGADGEGARQFQLLRDETEIEATRRLRDTLVANISHEFRTPLSAQLASIEMLRERTAELGGADAQNLLLAIERGTLRLARLVDNLLESLRIDAGETSIRHQPVALDQVVEEAVEATAPLIEQRGQKLAVDLPYPMPSIDGDPQRLAQVLVNLLANSNKFAPAGASIRLSALIRETEVELRVEDDGPGLPGGGDQAIFERFVRAPGDEPEESGMGLGLWIVKSIVERHGGRVVAQALSPGTRMCVILPRGDR